MTKAKKLEKLTKEVTDYLESKRDFITTAEEYHFIESMLWTIENPELVKQGLILVKNVKEWMKDVV